MKRGERKNGFIKGDMARDVDFVGTQVKALVATMIGRETKENTRSATSLEFVDGSGGEVGVAKTPKNANVSVSGITVVED